MFFSRYPSDDLTVLESQFVIRTPIVKVKDILF